MWRGYKRKKNYVIQLVNKLVYRLLLLKLLKLKLFKKLKQNSKKIIRSSANLF